MVFPNYDESKSDFKGMLRLINTQAQEKLTLIINKGNGYPVIESQGKLSSFVIRDHNGLVTESISIPEMYGYFYTSKDRFVVYYKVGEFSGGMKLIIKHNIG